MALSGRAAQLTLVFTGIVLMLSVMAFSAQAQSVYGPRLRIQEEVSSSYDWTGAFQSAPSSTGQFRVSVPNNDDVLQYLYIDVENPEWYEYTNIQNSRAAYHNVLTSRPNDWDWENLYVNTSVSDSDSSYVLNDSAEAPSLNLTMYYENSVSGKDYYSVENIDNYQNNMTVVFSIENPHTTRTFSGVRARIYLRLDTGPSGEEPDILPDFIDTASASVSIEDRDSDGEDDSVHWYGIDIGPGATVNLTIYVNITTGYHVTADSYNMQGATEDGMNATWMGTGNLFSGLVVQDKFTRGPIRQGIDMSASGGFWYVRGFFRNMGNADGGYNLTYNISDWSIYSVDPATGAPFGSANQSGKFNQTSGTTEKVTTSDGRVYTTNDSRSSNTSLWNSSSTTKPYVAVSWDWEVLWNETNSEENLTYLNSTMDFTSLYLVDLSGVKAASGIVSPNVGGENVTINDTMTYLGHDNTDPTVGSVLSYVPNNTTLNEWRGSGWFIQDLSVWVNTSYQIANDSSNCILTVTQPLEDATGLVNFSFYDLNSCPLVGGGTVGDLGGGSETIKVSYIVTSDVDMTTGDTYVFWGIGNVNSSTGTSDREYFNNQTVAVAGKRLTGYKDLIAYDPDTPTLINGTIRIDAQDSSGSGITGIKFMDYVPSSVSYSDYTGNFSNGDWVLKINGVVQTLETDYQIHNNGTVTLPDGLEVNAFEFVNYTAASGNSTWNLSNGDYIEVSYQINYTDPGVYVLPTTIAAFDPDTGASLETALYGVIKVSIPEPNLPLAIEEGDLEQSKTVLVGKPATWNKDFSVYNPNPRQVRSTFEAVVFEDTSDGFVSFISTSGGRVDESMTFSRNGDGEKVIRWTSILDPFENRNYDVQVLTPPVIEIDRDVEVMEQLPNKRVRLKMDVFLKSFAKEEYRNVIMNLPISYENIEEVRDGFGNRLAFTGGKDASTITVDSMGAEELKTITVTYVESYPTVIITPDRDRYNLNSPVSLEILVINGGEKIDYPFLEVEIMTPSMDVIFTDIKGLSEMDPLEKTEMYEKFVIPATAPEGMYIASAKFREDFATLASTTGNFYVVGVSGGIPEALEIIMIVLVGSVLLFFSWRRFKEVRNKSPYGRFGGV